MCFASHWIDHGNYQNSLPTKTINFNKCRNISTQRIYWSCDIEFVFCNITWHGMKGLLSASFLHNQIKLSGIGSVQFTSHFIYVLTKLQSEKRYLSHNRHGILWTNWRNNIIHFLGVFQCRSNVCDSIKLPMNDIDQWGFLLCKNIYNLKKCEKNVVR